MKVKNREEAWAFVNDLIDWDYEQDMKASSNAGYPIYMATRPGLNAWISDLNCRLEVNENGSSVNVWIDAQEERDESSDLFQMFGVVLNTGSSIFETTCPGKNAEDVAAYLGDKTLDVKGPSFKAFNMNKLSRAMRFGGFSDEEVEAMGYLLDRVGLKE